MSALPDLNRLSLVALYRELEKTGLIDRLFRLAHDEDLVGAAKGDITSICWGAASRELRADLVAREAMVVAGLATLDGLCGVFAPDVSTELYAKEGDRVDRGTVLATLGGPSDQVLRLERTMLNLIGRLSGIATLASQYAERAAPVGVLDTRKTTPGLRVLEKYAVRCGGGLTHRMGLHDAVLLKDNHLASVKAGELAACVREAAARARGDRALRFVEVEVDALEQLRELLTLDAGVVDIVLLDNMRPAMLEEAVRMRDEAGSPVLLEASGGVTLETISGIAATGVDRISVGALTHQAVSVDVGLDAAG